MKRLIFLLLFVFSFLLFTSCSNTEASELPSVPLIPSQKQEYPVEVEDTVIEEEPQRIVCLSPSLTEIIYTLGYGDKLIGVGDGCDYPEKATELPILGNVHTPDLEQIKELQPEYLLVSSDLVEENLVALQQMGVGIIKISPAKSLEDLERVYSTLGAVLDGNITGAQVGVELFSVMNARITELRWVVSKANLSCYLIRMLDNTLATGDTFTGDLLEQLGFSNLAENSTGWALSSYTVKETNPDVLFVDQSIDIEDVKNCSLYQNSNAVKNGAIYQVDTLLFERQSKRLVAELERMASLAYPDGFKGSKA